MQVLHVVTFSCSATSRLVRLRSFAALPLADERAATFLVAQHSHVVRIAQIHLCVTLCDVEVDREDEIDYDKSLDKRDPESKIRTVDVATLAPDIASWQLHCLACQMYRLLHLADLSSIPFREFAEQHDIQIHEVLHAFRRRSNCRRNSVSLSLHNLFCFPCFGCFPVRDSDPRLDLCLRKTTKHTFDLQRVSPC